MKKSELRNLIKEAISEVVSEEAKMATSDLEAARHYIEHLGELVNDNSDLEDWVKAKINIAKENLRTAFEYLSHESKGQGQTAVSEDAGGINLDVNKIEDVEVDGVDSSDYPDFSNAYVVSAVYPIVDNPKNPNDWRELTDEELDWLNDKHPEIAQGAAHEDMIGQADAYYDSLKDMDEAKKKWIQKAVNPKHKGYCTPMTKKTCTPARKALAKRFKKGI